MASINTVLGSIPADELGVTLIHEHLASGFPGWECDAVAAPYDRDAVARVCVDALLEARGRGLRTLVDATPMDLGRDVELQKRVAEAVGINIVCATGLYVEALGAAGYFKFRSSILDVTTEMYDIFMKEITQGIRDSGVRAGVIKVATGHGHISAYEEMVLRAAAQAQRDTGVPIITHTEAGTMGPEQADMLISEGADPKRIVIGHMCGNANLEYQISVLDRGVYVGFDRFGVEAIFPDKLRKACLVGLLGIGYSRQIVLSHDYIPQMLGRPMAPPEVVRAALPHWSFTHVFANIIPALREAGVSDDTINTMTVDNPRRLLAGG